MKRTPSAAETPTWVRALPLILFAIFALFWSTMDLIQGLWQAILPSVIVGIALLLRYVSPPAEEAAQEQAQHGEREEGP